MSLIAYFGKFGALRLEYQSDGAGGNYYLEIPFEGMDFNATINRPRPDELPVMDRGVLNAYAHHIQGPDTPIIQPVTMTWSCMIDNTYNRVNLAVALCNAPRISPWQINGVGLSNVNGTTMLYNGAGSLVSTPLPYDTLQDRITVAVLFRGDPHLSPLGTDDYGHVFNEVWFAPSGIRVVEAPDSYKFNVTGSIYGPISTLTAFSAGTALTSYIGTI